MTLMPPTSRWSVESLLESHTRGPAVTCGEANWTGGRGYYGRSPRRCRRRTTYRCGACTHPVCGEHAKNHLGRLRSACVARSS